MDKDVIEEMIGIRTRWQLDKQRLRWWARVFKAPVLYDVANALNEAEIVLGKGILAASAKEN